MLRDARERYDVPVVEVIQPAVRRAVATTRNRRVGVIGTAGTIQSRAYDDAFAAAPHLELFSAACPRFVEFVEDGITSGDELLSVAEEYLAPLRAAQVDTLVLGCTHYPFLKGAISYVMGEQVTLVSSDVETANDVYRVLVSSGMERHASTPPTYRYEATGDSTSAFLDLAHRLIAPEIPSVELVHTGAVSLPASTSSAPEPSTRSRTLRQENR
jgi:glutamate racemase